MGNSYNIIISRNSNDSDWDEYVNNHEMGQFQQTSIWARAKESEGWSASRAMMIDGKGSIFAGFQLLRKNIYRLFTIGLISKGPLYTDETDNTFMELYNMIMEEVNSKKTTALILQTDDRDNKMWKYLRNNGFNENKLVEILTATSVIDLSPPIDEIWERMNRTRRQEIKKAINNKFQFTMGSKSDLKMFYKLMEVSCGRINQKPNISSYEALCKFWDTLSGSGMIQIFLVKHDEKIVTSLITISYKQELHLWRYAWSGECNDYNPNAYLYWEIIRWAKEKGYRSVDLGGIDRNFALSCINKLPLPKNNMNSLFKMKFGGEIRLLPESLILFRSRIGNNAYSKIMDRRLLKYVSTMIQQ